MSGNRLFFVRKQTKYNKMCVCGNHSVYIKDGRSLGNFFQMKFVFLIAALWS